MKHDSDWRINVFSYLKNDWLNPWTNSLVKAGTQITVVACAKNKQDKEFSVPLPNATAMMINASQRAYRNASLIRRKNKIEERGKGFKSPTEAIDFLEHVMESVLLAHAGLEAFANDLIPEDHIHEDINKKTNEVKTMDKEKIQRHVSLSEKLSIILPNVLNKNTPKGNSKCWEEYLKLSKLRNRITHMKSEDRKSASSDIDTIWRALIYSDPPHQQALSIIKYFEDSLDPKPLWLEKLNL